MDLILNTTYNIFELIYNSGSALWYFFSMPLSDQIGMPDDIVAFFGDSLFELMFGVSITMALIYALLRFIYPF